MSANSAVAPHLASLNAAQREAVTYGDGDVGRAGPLLIIAGAGSGKTTTLAHRVAHLVLGGANPDRLLLLTFTRRAAAEMTRRAEQIVAAAAGSRGAGRPIRWAGTFHAVANRLLRLHADGVGLDPAFTVLDRGDSADLMDMVRHELDLSSTKRRFPQKSTCLSIYSYAINARRPLDDCLRTAYPWCTGWADELKRLFLGYTDAKRERHVLDYDDLLLYWFHLMSEPRLAAQVAERFDHVLVDEYQDTGPLEGAIVLGLRPAGTGVTVVGDDAQAIYSFRAATVHNILEFPSRFDPPASVVTLEQNYRSTQPILDAANGVIALAPKRFTKNLFSTRQSQQKPRLVSVDDDTAQARYVVDRVLAEREGGVALKRQAVLFRAAHHSDGLELELARCNIPFVKFGGLKFLEAAHVKDSLCPLRLAENPRDALAAFRVIQLLPGCGPATAHQAFRHVEENGFALASLATFMPPAAARADWPGLCKLLARLHDAACPWPGQVAQVRAWYQPHLERCYDAPALRAGDLDQLEQIAGQYATRERFLSELTLDPPSASGADAGPPLLDEDYLILSTIHSAKGQEWDVVYVLNAVDGCIPSDMATSTTDQIEEERRLLYVALTRARDGLHVIHPRRFFVRQQHRHGDRHVLAPLTRFITEASRAHFESVAWGQSVSDLGGIPKPTPAVVDVAAKLRDQWM